MEKNVFRLGSLTRLFTGIFLRKWILLWLGRTSHLTPGKLLCTSTNSLMLAGFSRITQTKLHVRQLLKHYCKADLDVRLVFSTFKLRNMFSVKDSVLQGLSLPAVYKFYCAGCNASYIGETTPNLWPHVREHLLSDRSLHVYRHLQSSWACHDSCTCTTECFTILDSAALKFQIKIKEALHIKWENPILNQQLKHLDLSLSFLLRFSYCPLSYCSYYAHAIFVFHVFHTQIETQVFMCNFETYLKVPMKWNFCLLFYSEINSMILWFVILGFGLRTSVNEFFLQLWSWPNRVKMCDIPRAVKICK